MSTSVKRATSTQQHDARIVQAAEEMLVRDGEHGLQMKQLAQRAGVALATLYRYFPSKDHVLAAVALHRHQRTLHRIDTIHFQGSTPGERAADLLMREFRAVQREPATATALHGAMNAPDRAISEYAEATVGVMEKMLLAAISQDSLGTTPEQVAVLPIAIAIIRDATSRWLGGTIGTQQARGRLGVAARLFDLPPDIVREYLS